MGIREETGTGIRKAGTGGHGSGPGKAPGHPGEGSGEKQPGTDSSKASGRKAGNQKECVKREILEGMLYFSLADVTIMTKKK